MPATKNTFLIFPFRFGPGITARAKSKLVRIQLILEDSLAEPGTPDQIGFWKAIAELGFTNRSVLAGEPATAASENTFLAARVRYGPGVTPMARTTLTRIENELGSALATAPTNPEKIRLWDCLTEEAARALDKLEGRTGGDRAAAAAGRDTGGEGEQG